MKTYKLIHGDCLRVMARIPDYSIDLILCDLPYGTTQCAWDSALPFDLLWLQYKRIIKKNSAIVLFGAEPFSSLLRTSNLKMYKYDWVWQKNTVSGHTCAKLKPLNDHELISVFSEGTTANCSPNLMPYYPQGLQKINKITSGLQGRSDYDKNGHNFRRASNKDKIVQEYTNYPKRTLQFSCEVNNVHPTQKPVKLLEYLIKTYSNEGDTVLDNTMGSGSTGVAALKCNRKFIGIEKELEYYNIAKHRLESIPKKLFE
jgi:site-specific DNA-methyltransferase (adenine-specific)